MLKLATNLQLEDKKFAILAQQGGLQCLLATRSL
jgi:hypothetical protein